MKFIKTDEEMVKEFGKNWRNQDHFWEPDKEWLLGQRILNHFRVDSDDRYIQFRHQVFVNNRWRIDNGEWLIPRYMIKEISDVDNKI
jgi:hypothetical protein